jgi:hypothetical protein
MTSATFHKLLETEGKTVIFWIKSTAFWQTDEWMVFGDQNLTAAGNVQ